jgi:glycosyltransferase involved in cell wall biosynthesis
MEKRRLVVLVGIFYPNPSPTGMVTRQYLDLLKEQYDISIVFAQSGLTRYNSEIVDDYTLFSLYNWRLYYQKLFELKSKDAKHQYGKTLYNLIGTIFRAIGRVQTLLLLPDNNLWYHSKALIKIEELNRIKPIEYLLTVCSPFTAHTAGRKFKQNHKHTRWLTMTFDPLVHMATAKRSFIIPMYKKVWSTKREINLFNSADYNFLTEDIFDNCNDIFINASNKTSPLPFLIKHSHTENIEYFNSSMINFVFAGRFYREIRNPEYLLKTFLSMKSSISILHLFITSDCDELIDKYVKRSNGKIIVHTPVSVIEIKKIMNNADVLINVSNSIAAFKPSKIFEYISTGKPIVNIHKNRLPDKTLRKYPNAMQIDSDNTDLSLAAEKLLDFYHQNNSNQLTWDEITMLYPGNSPGHIKNILDKGFL